MNFSDFETSQKIKRSAEEIKRLERELLKRQKALAENRRLAERLGLGQSETASLEASIKVLRVRLMTMKARHIELYGSDENSSEKSASTLN